MFRVAPLVSALHIGFKLSMKKTFSSRAVPNVIIVQEFILFSPSF
jgi:hypothetical protein